MLNFSGGYQAIAGVWNKRPMGRMWSPKILYQVPVLSSSRTSLSTVPHLLRCNFSEHLSAAKLLLKWWSTWQLDSFISWKYGRICTFSPVNVSMHKLAIGYFLLSDVTSGPQKAWQMLLSLVYEKFDIPVFFHNLWNNIYKQHLKIATMWTCFMLAHLDQLYNLFSKGLRQETFS